MNLKSLIESIIKKNNNDSKGNVQFHPVMRQIFSLGTVINLTAYGENSELALDKAVYRVNEIDDKMSAFKDFSEVSAINKNAGGEFQSVGKDTFYVIKKALHYANLTEGTFEPTIRPLVKLWNISRDISIIPEAEKIKEALSLVNYKDIQLDEKNYLVKLKKPYESIDLGSIAKGYATDEVKRILIDHNIKSAILDLGGNIYALGQKQDGTPWRIGIQDPLNPRGEFIGVVSVENKSVVTSGNYEKFFVKDNKRYHHLLNSKTGYPVDNGIISTTVISDLSIDGDALTTAIYVMGVEEGMKLIEGMKGVDAIFVTEEKGIYLSSGLKDSFQLVKESFQLKTLSSI